MEQQISKWHIQKILENMLQNSVLRKSFERVFISKQLDSQSNIRKHLSKMATQDSIRIKHIKTKWNNHWKTFMICTKVLRISFERIQHQISKSHENTFEYATKGFEKTHLKILILLKKGFSKTSLNKIQEAWKILKPVCSNIYANKMHLSYQNT